MATGPGLVTASDLIYPAEIEIANPELHLATLDGAESRLELELTVEAGRGYLPSDGREPPALGVIPVDAIFTPVRRVNYSVDATRVGARTDFDRLVIEINTDGTIRPVEAMAQAANLLIQHFAIIADLTRAGARGEKPTLGVGAVPPHIAEMPIEQLELSQRTYNCLKRSQITRVGQILEKTSDELLQLRNFGQKSLQELQDKLRGHGLSLPGTDLEGGDGLGDLPDEGDEDEAEDELSAELMGTDVVSEPEEAESEEGLDEVFEGMDELEDDEPVQPRAGRARPAARGRRAGDDWGD
jgi:DNA-directed RNA polymerase subunit alpha